MRSSARAPLSRRASAASNTSFPDQVCDLSAGGFKRGRPGALRRSSVTSIGRLGSARVRSPDAAADRYGRLHRLGDDGQLLLGECLRRRELRVITST